MWAIICRSDHLVESIVLVACSQNAAEVFRIMVSRDGVQAHENRPSLETKLHTGERGPHTRQTGLVDVERRLVGKRELKSSVD